MKDEGMSIRAIARKYGVSRNTVIKYMDAKKPLEYQKREPRSPLIDPYRETIKALIDEYDLSAVRIMEEIKKKGYTGGYSLVKACRHEVRKNKKIIAVYRYETKPGKQSQVDFGEFGHIEIDGKNRKLYAFSIILGYSRMRYVEFTIDISTENTIKMHLNAFIYFGGYTDTILYDNMKQVVLDRKLKASESEFNKGFMDLMNYYGITTRLCWPYRPQTKGKIENTIKFVKGNFFNGRMFESLSDINAQASQWMEKVNSQIHGTTGKIPREMLKDENLNPTNTIPEYIPHVSVTRKVSRECYVWYKGNRYSFPWKYAGRESTVVEKNGKICITVDSEIVEHDILPGTGRISRKKEHFEGLLKAIEHENLERYDQIVEKRDLKEYEEVK